MFFDKKKYPGDYFYKSDFNNLFSKGGSAANDGIRNLSIAAVYAISNNYNNNEIQSKYRIIRDFSSFSNNAFYKLGIVQIPPVRIIFKNFED